MPPTKEQLLIKRYKLITPWPGHLYKADDIIEEEQINISGIEYNLKDYPKIFQPLPWWSDRKLEDMPEYIKWLVDNSVHKVFDWKVNSSGWLCDISVGYIFMKDIEISTAEEYTAYINQKQQ